MKCILHIGCEKTGTTTIQAWLRLNRDALSRQGIYVPNWIGACGHTRLTWLALNYQSGGSRWRQIYSGLKKELTGPLGQNKTVLFSSEHLQGRLRKQEDIESLKDVLLSLGFREYHVILYIRDQSQTALSLYSTWVKNGYKERITKLIYSDYFRELMNHQRSISKWSSVFGKKAMSVRLFPPQIYHGTELIDDFAFQCKLPQCGEYDPVNTQNEKLSPECLEFLLRLNRSGYPWWMISPLPRYHLVAALVGLSASHAEAKLSALHSDQLYALYKSSNEEVRKEYFPERKTLFEQIPRTSSGVNAKAYGSMSDLPQSDFSREMDDQLINGIEQIFLVPPSHLAYLRIYRLLYAKLRFSISNLRKKIAGVMRSGANPHPALSPDDRLRV
jgi:hypothetical protein